LSNISVSSHRRSNHKATITIEACLELLLFKQGPVRIEALRLAIRKKNCSKILDNVDKLVVELWLVPYLLMVTVNLIIDMRLKLLKLLRQWAFVET